MRRFPLWRGLAPLALASLAGPLVPLLRAQVPARVGAPAFAEEAPQAEPQKKADEGPKPLPARGPKSVEGSLPKEWVETLSWRSIGPANMGGRITDIAANPDDPAEYWIGTATGGVVYTNNRGTDYEHQFGDQRVSSIGAIAVAPSDPKQVWVGTGEANPRNSVSWGDGVYKSTDGGKTWGHAGLSESFQISTIVVHPTNPDVAYVGALGRLWGPNDQRGLYKTTDGGHSWERVWYLNDETGVVEVKLDPNDPETLLIAAYDRRRDEFDTNDPFRKWSEHSGIHKSTDGGKTWKQVTDGLPTVKKGRIGITWSGQTPGLVLAIVESERITQTRMDAAWLGVQLQNAEVGVKLGSLTEEGPALSSGLKEGDLVLRIGDDPIVARADFDRLLYAKRAGDEVTFEVVRDGKLERIVVKFGEAPKPDADRFDDAGRPPDGPFSSSLGGQRENIQDNQGPEGFEHGGVYKSTDHGDTWTRINSVNPRPMYYSEIRLDPSDDNYVYVLGTSLYRSKDGGATFTPDGGNDGIHVDHHALWIDPTDGRHMVLGNDGGIHVTWDRMESWEHHNALALGQFYNVAVDPRRDYRVYGGLQDNGSWGGPSRARDGVPINEDWFRVGGGDGFVCRVDPEDPDLIYSESQNGGMGRRNLRTGEGASLRPRGGRDARYRFNWNTPFLLSHHNSRIFYAGGNHVFRSIDRGEDLATFSPEITATDRGAAVALHESPRDPDLVYVGTDDGALWVTRDGGKEWIDLMALDGKPAFEQGDEAKEGEAAEAPGAAKKGAKKALTVALSADEISGTWKAKASGQGIEKDDQGRFTLQLALGDGDTVTGRIESEIGTGPIANGRYDAASKKLSFTFKGEALAMDVTATLGAEGLAGELVALGGAFRFAWTAVRDGQAPVTSKTTGDVVVAAAATEEATATEATPPAGAERRRGARGGRAGRGDGEVIEAGEGTWAPTPRKRRSGTTIDQLLPGRRYVSDIKASQHNTKRVYVTFDGHRSDDLAPYVFMSEDAGDTWKSLRGNLPDEVGSVRAILEDKDAENVLYLGTEFGAYVSVDMGASWTRMNSNLPTVPVHDFAQHPLTGDLIAATHGRSVWILDAPFLGQVNADVLAAEAHLFQPADVVVWRRGLSRWTDNTRTFRGENPATSAVLHYSLGKRASSVQLEVRNAAGDQVQVFEAPRDKGLHRVEWSLSFRPPADAAGQERGAARGQGGARRGFGGRRAGTGDYVATLTVDGRAFTRSFSILADPNEPDGRYIALEDAFEELEAELEAERRD
ncbi:MAG: PDZ domain-containing protein [Planctomycetota bacterium]